MNPSERMLALHGPLVCRVVDRMMHFRAARTKAMIEAKSMKEIEIGAHLDSYAEATAVVATVQAAKFSEFPRSYDIDTSDEIGAYFRLYTLTEGHVLTAQDILDLEAVLAELNDEIGNQADKEAATREATLREIGGEELVKAVQAADLASTDKFVKAAMARFYAAFPSLKEEGASSPS